jgi:hypothetical protein
MHTARFNCFLPVAWQPPVKTKVTALLHVSRSRLRASAQLLRTPPVKRNDAHQPPPAHTQPRKAHTQPRKARIPQLTGPSWMLLARSEEPWGVPKHPRNGRSPLPRSGGHHALSRGQHCYVRSQPHCDWAWEPAHHGNLKCMQAWTADTEQGRSSIVTCAMHSHHHDHGGDPDKMPPPYKLPGSALRTECQTHTSTRKGITASNQSPKQDTPRSHAVARSGRHRCWCVPAAAIAAQSVSR